MRAKSDRRHLLRTSLALGCIAAALYLVVLLANFIATSDGAQEIIARFGFFGVALVAFISGFNILIPLPPATFVPIFSAAGFALPFIVAGFVVGTLIADLAGYAIGLWGKQVVAHHYPKTEAIFRRFKEKHRHLVLPLVFCYAAFVPLPNEAFVIPLAMIGVHIRSFIVPLLLGTIIHHTITVYGAYNLFAFFS